MDTIIRTYHMPFYVTVPEKSAKDCKKLAELFVEYLTSFGNVYLRVIPTIETQHIFETGEEETRLRFRLGLQVPPNFAPPGKVIKCSGAYEETQVDLGTLVNPPLS